MDATVALRTQKNDRVRTFVPPILGMPVGVDESSGRPLENGFIESFNGRLRDECLNVEWFGSLHEAQKRLAQWRDHYNLQRPHSALDDRAPASFASAHMTSATCFAPIERNTASCGPHQGFAAPAKNAALDPVPRLPENLQYRGEAL